jgi:hypothetical protein
LGLFVSGWPFKLVFWRKHPDVSHSFHSPIMDCYGVLLAHLMEDELHGLHLGLVARLISENVKQHMLDSSNSASKFEHTLHEG